MVASIRAGTGRWTMLLATCVALVARQASSEEMPGPWVLTAGGRLLAVYEPLPSGSAKPTLVYGDGATAGEAAGGTVGPGGATRSER